jgi:hypothetical protein
MRRSLFCLSILATFSAHAEIRNAGEVDKAGMGTIWLQVATGKEGLVIKSVLVGEMAAAITDITGSPGPFQATVSRVKKYSEPSCSRIRVVYLFPAARTVDGGRRNADITYEQDICLRDYMPRDTHAEISDADKVAKASMVSGWVQKFNEVDKVGMEAIWRQVINGDEGLVIKTVLTGEMAAKISDATGSSGPFQAKVNRVKKYIEPGCARIHIEYLFPAIKTVEGVPEDINVNYEQNFCLDGRIPRETTNQKGMKNDPI